MWNWFWRSGLEVSELGVKVVSPQRANPDVPSDRDVETAISGEGK